MPRNCCAVGCRAAAASACANCTAAWYCSPACQSAHWPAHKLPCKAHKAAEAAFQRGLAAAAVGDLRAAAACYATATAQRHADACFHLGDAFMFGAGVAMDKPRAVALWRAAAEVGHLRAMHALLWGRGQCACRLVCTCKS